MRTMAENSTSATATKHYSTRSIKRYSKDGRVSMPSLFRARLALESLCRTCMSSVAMEEQNDSILVTASFKFGTLVAASVFTKAGQKPDLKFLTFCDFQAAVAEASASKTVIHLYDGYPLSLPPDPDAAP